MSTVRVPPVLRDEAGGAREVNATGATVRELLEDLTTRMPAPQRVAARVLESRSIRGRDDAPDVESGLLRIPAPVRGST